jgi:hypothetical protein
LSLDPALGAVIPLPEGKPAPSPEITPDTLTGLRTRPVALDARRRMWATPRGSRLDKASDVLSALEGPDAARNLKEAAE